MKVKLNKEMCKKYKIRSLGYIVFAVDFKGRLLTEENYEKTSCTVFTLPPHLMNGTFEIIDSSADSLLHKHTYEPFKALFEEIED